MTGCAIPVIHVDDVGTRLRLQLVDQQGEIIDIATATLMEITIKQPSGTTVTRTATHYTDGTDGIMEIEAEAGDFPVASPNYRMQGHVELANFNGRTEVEFFQVEANI